MGENYGKQMLMKVLAGSKNKAAALGLDIYLPMDWWKTNRKETMQLIEYLISNGYLLTINGEYPVWK